MENYPIEIDLSLDGRRPEVMSGPEFQPPVCVFFTRSHEGLRPDLTALLGEAGITSEALQQLNMTSPGADLSGLPTDVIMILGTAGGLRGIAAVLKAFFGRHKDKTVKFGPNGEVLQTEGLSVGDLTRLLNTVSQNNQRWPMVEAASFRETSGRCGDGRTLNNLGNAHWVSGRLVEAVDCYLQSRIICLQAGDLYGEGMALANLGRAYRQMRRIASAASCWREAAGIMRDAGDHEEARRLERWAADIQAGPCS
ncbi:MAG TPA: tetratricopeptide repeat protein [Trebonia sp.]|nr:tetratricopeptide repeat protein [Trebonia sp.]